VKETDGFAVLLVTIPIGKLGDHHGRKKIMALSLLGVAGSLIEISIVCTAVFFSSYFLTLKLNCMTVQLILFPTLGAFPRTFPLRLVWLSSMILLCGGGFQSASAFMWAMVSESVPAEKRQVPKIPRDYGSLTPTF